MPVRIRAARLRLPAPPRRLTQSIRRRALPAPVAGTGYDFADFLLGYAQQTSLAYSQVHDQYLGDSYDLFVQDDWRVRGNLTLNFGLRYEFISPFHEAHNQLANLITQFDAEGNFLTATAVSIRDDEFTDARLMNPERNNFAPRVGIAWKPFGAKTVVRAGYGINYNLGQYASIVQNLAAHPPCADRAHPRSRSVRSPRPSGSSTPPRRAL